MICTRRTPCFDWSDTDPLAQQDGFTLLEIMVVMVLIGISITLVSLNLYQDSDQVAELEAHRFASLLEHVRDESVLTGRTYAVEIDELGRQYGFLIYDDEWMAVEQDDVLRKRFLPEYLDIRFDLINPRNDRPMLVIDALGELTPFVLTISSEQLVYVVSMDNGENISVRRTQREPG